MSAQKKKRRTANITTLACGQDLIPPKAWKALAKILGLSPRQAQVVRCVFDDCKQGLIATKLGISVHTVDTYIQRLYQKLNVRSRIQLVIYVVAAYLAMQQNGSGEYTQSR